MFMPRTAFTVLAATLLSACASIDLPDVDFMGNSDFNDEISALDTDFPSADETPDLPTEVRRAEDWDESARELQEIYDEFEVPDLEPALSDAEFNRQFEAAQAAVEAYKQDDPS